MNWRGGSVVTVEGLEPSRNDLEVRTGPKIKGSVPLFAPYVQVAVRVCASHPFVYEPATFCTVVTSGLPTA